MICADESIAVKCVSYGADSGLHVCLAQKDYHFDTDCVTRLGNKVGLSSCIVVTPAAQCTLLLVMNISFNASWQYVARKKQHRVPGQHANDTLGLTQWSTELTSARLRSWPLV